MTPDLRPATEADLDALAQLWHDAWHSSHPGNVPQSLVDLRNVADFRARLPAMLPDLRTAGPVGAPQGLCATDGDEMKQLFVSATAQGTGLATALLADAEARMARAGHNATWLAVVSGNDRAIRFYRREGWQLADIRDIAVDTAAGKGCYTLTVQIMTKALR